MLRLVYLYRNLTRNPLRTLLTCAAVALPIMIYVLSMAVVDGLDRFLDNSAKQLRLVVINKSSFVHPLPGGYRSKIESLDPTHTRLVSVCAMQFIGGRVEDDPRPLSTLAVDADAFVATFPEYALTPEEIAAWNRDRQAIVVGSGTAVQFGWKVGDRITIRGSLPPYSLLEFHIIATSKHSRDPITNLCRRDYLQAELDKYDWLDEWISFFFVKCATQEDLDYFRVAIDDLFAHSPDATKTQDEKAFINDFITQVFDLPTNLTILAAVTVFVAIMAAANTMSMNFRDRSRELAVLKSIGFSRTLVFGLLQSESILLCVAGGAVGAAIPYVAFTHTALKEYTVPLIIHLQIEPSVCVKGVLISLVIGILAAAWPSWQVLRMKVVVALRTIE